MWNVLGILTKMTSENRECQKLVNACPCLTLDTFLLFKTAAY